MSRKAVQRWVFGVAAPILLVAGVVQLFQEFPLGWAAVVSAALIGIGLALAMKSRWGRLLAVWGLMTGIVWLLAMLFGFLGRGYDFSYAGWVAGIVTSTYFFWQDYQDDRAGHELNGSTESPDTL
jgi:ABC-type multidrug transport system permease subunit